VETRLGTCIGCGKEESLDCQLYLCKDKDGFLVICCIVYAINNSLTILKRLDGLLDKED
jgi:hypothetical protein